MDKKAPLRWVLLKDNIWYLRGHGYVRRDSKGEWWIYDDVYASDSKSTGPFFTLKRAKEELEIKVYGRS